MRQARAVGVSRKEIQRGSSADRNQSGDKATVDAAQLEEMLVAFRGPVLRPGDPGYDNARVVYNGDFDRRPGLIIRCSGTADVIDAVNFARERDLVVAVRGGGHNVAGNSVCDDG